MQESSGVQWALGPQVVQRESDACSLATDRLNPGRTTSYSSWETVHISIESIKLPKKSPSVVQLSVLEGTLPG